MPNSLVKSFAKKSGKSVEEVEKLWQEAEQIAKKNDVKEESKYAYIVGILKKMLSIDEDFSIGVGGPAALDAGVPESGESGVFANKMGKTQKRKGYTEYLKSKLS